MGHPPDFEWGRDPYDNFDNKPEFFYPYRDPISDGDKTGTMATYRAHWDVCGLCHTSAGLVQIERPHTDTDMDYVLVAPYSGGRYERRRGKPLDRCTRIICFDPAGRTALSCDRTASGQAALKVGQRSRKGVFINDNTCGDSCRSAFTAA